MSKGFMCRQVKLSQSAYLPEVDRSLKLKLKMSDLVSSPEIQATEDKVNMTVYTSVKEVGIGYLSASERLPKRAYKQPKA